MKNTFITSNNFRDYMKEAIAVYVGSSFLSRAIVDDIKENLSQLPFQGGKVFKFLVNEDFHEEPEMRKVLINMLLELKNTEVRIYRGPKTFHAKLYIYELGNSMFTTVGSFNATGGGAGGNIEAGVTLSNREIYKQAKAFFDKYWDSEHTEVARYDKSAFFVERKFSPGDSVIIKSTGMQGVILSDKPVLLDKEWRYGVFVSGKREQLKESLLEPLRVAAYRTEINFKENQDINIIGWMRNYILEKVVNITDQTIASFASSRTRVMAYQFRPLFKILHSKEHRILIADEVGLGKTIEAGIILKEFLSRKDMRRVLVIVPNSLKAKWVDELQLRFDEYFDILDSKDLSSFIDDYRESPSSAVLKGIITYDQLTVKRFREKLNRLSKIPVFDMIIIDEAHHLKNPSTLRHKVVKEICKNSNAIVMLTATPIQLYVKELYSILTILAPRFFEDVETNAFSAHLTLNEKINTAIQALQRDDIVEFCELINELKSKRTFLKQLKNFPGYEKILDKSLQYGRNKEKLEKKQLVIELHNLNILNKFLNRSLRKNVNTKFPDRVVKTYEYSYSNEEKEIYDAVLEECRARYSERPNIALIMPERRAASCLPAMYASLDSRELDPDDFNWFDNIPEEYKKTGHNSPITTIANRPKLPSQDSKFDSLKTIIDNILKGDGHDSKKKIMLFCAFHATIKYLNDTIKRLYSNVHVETLSGEDDTDARLDKKERFKEVNKPAILICTDVAGEGLDFQFCHYLINYDMPWNPSKLEQRVGRIDRIGQESEKVIIINLVNKYTIEDHIMALLFERVKLFNSTIGPLGDILNQCENNFSAAALSLKRTPKEKEKYEQKIMENMERQIREQKRFEKQQIELVGVMDYLYDEMRKNHNYFGKTELEFIWKSFIAKYSKENNIKVNQDYKDNIYMLHVDSKVKAMLTELNEQGLVGKFNKKKLEHYRSLINALEENRSSLFFTFDHECALAKLKIQFFNINHPLMQGAISWMKKDYKQNKSILNCTVKSQHISAGEYLLFIYRFKVMNSGPIKREHIEEKMFVYDRKKNKGDWITGNLLMEDILNGKDRVDEKSSIKGVVKKIYNFLGSEIEKTANSILEKYKKSLEINQASERNSIELYYQKLINGMKKNLQYIHDPRSRTQYEEEMKKICDEKEKKIYKLESTNKLNIIVRPAGIISIINEGGG